MVSTFMKVAFRNFQRHQTSTAINLIGLTVAFFSTIILVTYVVDETNYDRWHTDADRIFRFTTIDKALGVSSNNVAITNPMMPDAAEAELSEIEVATRMLHNGNMRLQKEDIPYYAQHAKYVEDDFFRIFDFENVDEEMLAHFHQPHKLILTESFATRVFQSADQAMGQTLRVNDAPWEIVGITKDPVHNSHLKYDVFLSLYPTAADSSFTQYLSNWQGLGMIGYAKLKSNTQEQAVEEALLALAGRNDVNDFWIPQLQPLTDIHLKSSGILFDYYHENKGDIIYVYALSGVAIFILLIAAFNFMNLATAQSVNRAKEVGIRKVMGSSKGSLISQYLLETILLSCLALIVALLLVFGLASQLPLGLDTQFTRILLTEKWLIPSFFGLAVTIGALSGTYPAFVLSGFKVISILRGKFQTSRKGVLLRKALITLQFVASISMIIVTLLVSQQLDYIKNKDLGFSKERIININDPALVQQLDVFKNAVENNPDVISASYSNNMPGRTFGRTGITLPGNAGSDEETWIVSVMSIDDAFLNTMAIDLAAGRNYGESYGADQQESIIINEAMAAALGFDEPIGKTLTLGQNQTRTIVGVIEDFHFANMKHKIEPLMLFYNPGPASNLNLKISNGDLKNTLHVLETTWRDKFPNHPFDYQFFDQEFNQIYASDDRFSTLVSNFTFVTILLSCMGLFGLSSFMAVQRRKEIGVRKVLGSNILQVVMLLLKEFVMLIGLASLLSFPLAYWVTNTWIGEFQYSIDLWSISSIMVYIGAALIGIVIGILTVSYKAFGAARVNPVQSLRDE